MSLLEKAKSSIPKRKTKEFNFTQEDYDLVYAWIEGEILLIQLQKAKGYKYTNETYCYIALVLRDILSSKNGKKK